VSSESGDEGIRINSEGQVTIPAELREKFRLHEGDEVDVIETGNALQIVRREGSESRGRRLTGRMRGRASVRMSTDELMGLLRGE
jgi:AbrB family looped-hinge helix DNA binding protein